MDSYMCIYVLFIISIYSNKCCIQIYTRATQKRAWNIAIIHMCSIVYITTRSIVYILTYIATAVSPEINALITASKTNKRSRFTCSIRLRVNLYITADRNLLMSIEAFRSLSSIGVFVHVLVSV